MPAIPRVFDLSMTPRDRRRLVHWAGKWSSMYNYAGLGRARDGTGPAGMGPRTGRGLGPCLSGDYQGGVYIPDSSQILAVPSPGAWYQIKKGETWWGVSKAAYGADNVKAGLMTINNARWNDHIERKRKGWEAYKVDGLQATPDYNTDEPHAGKGSGHDYPIAWIPPLSGEEPETVYPEPIMTVPVQPPVSGPAGPPGPIGPMGPQGPIGPMGPKGAQGAQGPKGAKGDPGEATDAAIMAAVRAYLEANPPPAGDTGPAGPPGPTGPRGIPGEMGPMGPPGATGPAGPMGPPGEATDAAIMAAVRAYLEANPPAAGPSGPMGPPGTPGDIGPMGPMGPAGPMGPQGPQGEAGAAGEGNDKGLWALPALALLSTL